MDIETKTVNVHMTLPNMERLADVLYKCVIFLGILAILSVVAGFFIPGDDTDAPGERSGLRPYTDHATGCQYLATRNGALTPRLDATGKQICRKEG